MMHFCFFLSLLILYCQSQDTQSFQVLISDVNNESTPKTPVLVYQNVSTQIKCCQHGATCTSTTSPFTLNPQQMGVISWYSCFEDPVWADPVACAVVNDWTTQSLIVVTSPIIGNCSIIANRLSYEAYLSTFPYTPYCAYKWSRSIRICGDLYCSWSDSTNTISVQCNKPGCSTSVNLDYCNIPWSTQFEPASYF